MLLRQLAFDILTSDQIRKEDGKKFPSSFLMKIKRATSRLFLTEKPEQISCQLFFVRGEQAVRRTVIFD